MVADTLVIQGEHGLYNLNALHKASEKANNKDKSPNQWLRLKSTGELIGQVKEQTANLQPDVVASESVCRVQNGGTAPGTVALGTDTQSATH